jgi:hypothetical protein
VGRPVAKAASKKEVRLGEITALVLAACSPRAAATDAGSPDSGGPPDSGAAPMTCPDIRGCVDACDPDGGCAQSCIDRAPTAAQVLYRALDDCSRLNCPMQDRACRCGAECYSPAPCEDESNACTGGDTDPFCDAHCH